jgi:hypothetical protein
VAIALIGGTLLTITFTFPETKYKRELVPDSDQTSSNMEFDDKGQETMVEAQPTRNIPKKKTYVQRLRIFSGVHTHESWFRLVMRPLALIVLPPVLWGTLVMSVTIGKSISFTYLSLFGLSWDANITQASWWRSHPTFPLPSKQHMIFRPTKLDCASSVPSLAH